MGQSFLASLFENLLLKVSLAVIGKARKLSAISKSLLYGRYFYFISWDVMEVLYCRVNFQIDKLVPVKGWWKERLLLWCHGQDLTSEKTHFNVALHTRSYLPEYQSEFFPAS